ncbi:transcription initiation factor IID, 18kD subunit-domain-containing protein [Kalaharituber pfeilii]|nr:transcription initiation factor IID, 18kD subunit-domain-containing protein [Kalaharituber pfeilii]
MNPDKAKYRVEIQQMMFVSGETGEPSHETTMLIEEIVRSQVIEMLIQCTALAHRRGSRTISTDDLIFLIRHDKAKVSRLRTYLSWKDVRKTAKENDKDGGAGDAGIDLLVDDSAPGGAVVPAAEAVGKRQKKSKIGLPWEVASYFSEQPPEREDDEDEDEVEANYATLQRLKNADERTRGMTKDEYVHWSECRQASFTFRKGKRFREWAGFGTVTEAKPNDDIVDILGFLTFEIVQTLTEEALRVKEAEDKVAMMHSSGDGKGLAGRKRKRERFLFQGEEERTPVEARHVEEAFRRLQQAKPKARAMRNFSGGVCKTRLGLV